MNRMATSRAAMQELAPQEIEPEYVHTYHMPAKQESAPDRHRKRKRVSTTDALSILLDSRPKSVLEIVIVFILIVAIIMVAESVMCALAWLLGNQSGPNGWRDPLFGSYCCSCGSEK